MDGTPGSSGVLDPEKAGCRQATASGTGKGRESPFPKEIVWRAGQSATIKEKPMNQDKIEGQWKQLRGKLQSRWGKLTDDDLDVAEGNTDYLTGKIQERYGIAKDEAKEQLRAFERDL
jgi:uncharacterized protein YjbJ (UPF0337 family)